jgi:glycosyltransferase involved in cell wall biosynthesis
MRMFGAALVGGRRHAAYLESLGMPRERIAFGYNAVDHDYWMRESERARRAGRIDSVPASPYFVAVNRFVGEKQMTELVDAYAEYRRRARGDGVWALALLGDGPKRGEIERRVMAHGLGGVVHLPGFRQGAELANWYAHAGAFVHPSRMEPWGLVGNEAAASGIPLLISNRAGCVETLVPEPAGWTGRRFDPFDLGELVDAMEWVSGLPADERVAMGQRARAIGGAWGPERFADGMMEAISMARGNERRRDRASERMAS